MTLLTALIVAAIGIGFSGAAVGDVLDPGAEDPSEGPSLVDWDPQLVNSSTVDTYQVEIAANNSTAEIALIRQRPQVVSNVTQRINMNGSFGGAMNPEIVAFEGDDGPQERISKDVFIDNGDVVVELVDEAQGAQQQARLTSITVEFEAESAPDPGLYNFSVEMEGQETTGGQTGDFQTLNESGVAQVEVVDATPASPGDLALTDVQTADNASQAETQLEVTGTVENPTGDTLAGTVVYGLSEDADPAFDGADLLTQQHNITVGANSNATATFLVDLTAADQAINTGDDIRHGIAAIDSGSNLSQALGITDGPVAHSADGGATVNRTTGLIQTAVDISSDSTEDVVAISLAGSPYGENVTVGVSDITIQGEVVNGDRPAVAWAGPQPADGAVTPPFTVENAENTTIANLQVEPLIPEAGGIDIQGGSGHGVIDVDMKGTNTGPPGPGVSITNVTGFGVVDSAIANKSIGVELVNATDGVVDGNVIQNNAQQGLLLDAGSSNNAVVNNQVDSNGAAGIIVGSSNSTIVGNNTVTASGGTGIVLEDAHGNDLVDNTATGNSLAGLDVFSSSNNTIDGGVYSGNGDFGIYLDIDSDDNVITNTEASDNPAVGVLILASDGTTLADVEAANNTNWDFEVSGSSGTVVENLSIGASTAPNTTLSFDAADVQLRANETPPADPDDALSVGRFFEAQNTSAGTAPEVARGTEAPTRSDTVTASAVPFLDVALSYEPGDVEGVNESSLELLRHNGTAWVAVPGSGVDTGTNAVTANVTEFSTFGAFGEAETVASSLSDLDIAGEGANAVIAEGADQDVTVNVTNAGDSASEFNVTLTIGQQVTVTETTASLDPGDTETVAFENVTGGLTISMDAYAVNVSTDTDTLAGDLRVHPDVDGNGLPARDTTGDGLLNDVNGDGTFDIFDVQVLFDNLDAPVVQDNAGFFQFAGIGLDRVSIFDIQGLYAELTAPPEPV